MMTQSNLEPFRITRLLAAYGAALCKLDHRPPAIRTYYTLNSGTTYPTTTCPHPSLVMAGVGPLKPCVSSSMPLQMVGCCCEEHLYQTTVLPYGKWSRIRCGHLQKHKFVLVLGLGTKKRRLHNAQKSLRFLRSGFRLCQR